MKMLSKISLGVGLLLGVTSLVAEPMAFNFDGALPYQYSGDVSVFSNTTFSGSFSYDSAGVMQANWDASRTGVDNVSFNVQFSNGLHASWTSALLFDSSWSGGVDLLSTAGGMFVIGGVFYGNYGFVPVDLFDSNNAFSGIQLNGLAFMMPTDGDSLTAGFDATAVSGAYGQVSVANWGLGARNVNISSVPDAASTLGLLSAVLLGLGLVRRRLQAA